jgi:hypothetical protein
MNDLSLLQDWVKAGPYAPDGEWYKDFGAYQGHEGLR